MAPAPGADRRGPRKAVSRGAPGSGNGDRRDARGSPSGDARTSPRGSRDDRKSTHEKQSSPRIHGAGSRVGPVPVARDAPESTAGAPVREQGMERAAPGSAGTGSRRVRDVRRASPQASAPVLRGVPAASAPGARSARDRRGAQGARRRRPLRAHDPRRGLGIEPRARRGDRRGRIGAIAAGRASTRASATRRGSSARSRRSSTAFRLARSPRQRAYRSRPARASGPGARVPHPRHWEGLLGLVEAGN